MIQHKAVRYGLFALWVAIAAGALYLYFFKRDAVQSELRDALSASFWIASISYLLIGALRAFTLVPATFPLLVAMPFFDPWVLLALTIPCIAHLVVDLLLVRRSDSHGRDRRAQVSDAHPAS